MSEEIIDQIGDPTRKGWSIVVRNGVNTFDLAEMPHGFIATSIFQRLSFQDALTVQGRIDILVKKKLEYASATQIKSHLALTPIERRREPHADRAVEGEAGTQA